MVVDVSEQQEQERMSDEDFRVVLAGIEAWTEAWRNAISRENEKLYIVAKYMLERERMIARVRRIVRVGVAVLVMIVVLWLMLQGGN